MGDSKFTRRGILKATASLPLVTSMPGWGADKTFPDQRKFLFLMASGGWDSTLVFEAKEGASKVGRLGGFHGSNSLQWTSSLSRPHVDRFFQRWGHRTAILNGIHTQSSGHAAAARQMLTGDAAPGNSDWPSLLARSTRKLEAQQVDSAPAFLGSLYESLANLKLGKSTCEFLSIPGDWDTHYDNSPQSLQFESFFASLNKVFYYMASTPGQGRHTLLDEVVIVAMSELGRASQLNEAGGKDHWPYTSALVAGSGIAGGRVIGATDEGLEALPLDFISGKVSRNGNIIEGKNLGATLLQLGGLPVSDHLDGVQSIAAVLA